MNASIRFLRSAFLLFSLVVFVFGTSCQRYVGITGRHAGLEYEVTRYPLLPDVSVKNVILYIGDGMGITHIATTRIKELGVKGRLSMERMPITGLVYTYSADELITDSAAGATAMATGYKTGNHRISVAVDGQRLLTILEAARRKGMKTGLVVTSEITHATPAAFAAHVKSRVDQDSIAVFLIENRVNVLLGGGKKYFIPAHMPGSGRKDDRNLLQEARLLGYRLVGTREELKVANENFILGLFQLEALETRPPEPSLVEMTAKALEILSKENHGFFLMVEGSQIDWGAHYNNAEYAVHQLRLFDEAVRIGLDFALKDRQTLVVVTADHETGGMSIVGGSLDGTALDIKWTTRHHTPEPVPLFAFGPQALRFAGVLDNTDIPRIFANLLGLAHFPEKRVLEKEISSE